MRAPGYVYVMVDPNTPGAVKVGSTASTPSDLAKARQLSLRDAIYFSDRTAAERFVHDSLEEHRAGSDPEMFQVPVETALAALSDAMERLVGTREGTREARPAAPGAPAVAVMPPGLRALKAQAKAPPGKLSLGKQIMWGVVFTTMLAGVMLFVIPTAVQIYKGKAAPTETAAPTDPAKGAEPVKDAIPKSPQNGSKPAAAKPKQALEKKAAAIATPPPAGAVPRAAPVIRNVEPAPAPIKKVEDPVPAPAAAEISGEELREHFAWDKSKATAAFKDGVVRIADVVTKVGKKDLSFRKIKCKFDAPPPAGLEVGATVTVEGTVKGKGFWTGNITLEHCRVL